MKILLLVVGRTTDKHLDALVLHYVERIRHYVPFELQVIPDVKNTRSLPVPQQKEREGELLLHAFREGDYIVLLDEGGKEYRSVELAEYLQRCMSDVARRLVFVVGGPYGFSATVYARARQRLSLSRLTFSHQMVRLFMVEQLYRAMTILRGEPYHHE